MLTRRDQLGRDRALHRSFAGFSWPYGLNSAYTPAAWFTRSPATQVCATSSVSSEAAVEDDEVERGTPGRIRPRSSGLLAGVGRSRGPEPQPGGEREGLLAGPSVLPEVVWRSTPRSGERDRVRRCRCTASRTRAARGTPRLSRSREREPGALVERRRRRRGRPVPTTNSGLDHAGDPESTHLVEIARARQHDVLNAQSMVGLETGRGGCARWRGPLRGPRCRRRGRQHRSHERQPREHGGRRQVGPRQT